jgi:hypothetical protein
MSGSTFGVTPKLPAQLIGISPIIVTKSGLTYTISLGSGASGAVTKAQWFEAVASLYNMNTLFVAVSVNANSAAWIQWYAGTTVAPNDAIATLTQSTFALNSSQIAALFALAATLPA